MIDRDPREVMAELAARIERLEALLVLLCERLIQAPGPVADASRQFIEDWRREHRG